MAKRLKYKNVDELVDALNAWIAASPNELTFAPAVRGYLTGTTSDSQSAGRLVDPAQSTLQLLSFRKEESKFNLVAVVKHKDIAVLLQRRAIDSTVPNMIAALDGFARAQGFESFQDMEAKVRAAHRRNLTKSGSSSNRSVKAATKEAQTAALEQHSAYGSW